MKCNYDFVYGKCRKEAEGSNAHCDVHMGQTCAICGKQASRDCSVSGQFVCGYPLCSSKECNDEHYRRAHIK